MQNTLVTGIAVVLAAKIIADTLRRQYGYDMPNRLAWARSSIEIDIAYLIALAAALPVVIHIGARTGLLIAILLHTSYIISSRILLPGNHPYLELITSLLCLRLLDQPGALIAALQLIVVTVWVYASYQKIYHREFLDGFFFYTGLQNPDVSVGPWWSRFIPSIPQIQGYYGALDAKALSFCRKLAILVVVSEIVLPLLAFALCGKVYAFLLLLALALMVGTFSGEMIFQITNVLISLTYLVPFKMAALSPIGSDPVALGLVVWLFLWPPIHAVITRKYRISSWKLAGWGMYATQVTRVDIVDEQGAYVTSRFGPRLPFWLLIVCGATRIRLLREYTSKLFFRWSYQEPANGLLFRWYRRRKNRYVTECVWVPKMQGALPETFEICDEHSELELVARLKQVAINDYQRVTTQVAA